MDFLNWTINLNPENLKSLIFGLIALFAGIVSLIMIWHWRKYGLGSKTLSIVEIIYLSGVVVLFSIAFLNI